MKISLSFPLTPTIKKMAWPHCYQNKHIINNTKSFEDNYPVCYFLA